MGLGQRWAEKVYGQPVKCCSCEVEMCTNTHDWQWCTGCTCPNANGAVVPDEPPSLEGMCTEWFDATGKRGNEKWCRHANSAMASHLKITVASKTAGNYTGSAAAGACVWCDCCAMLTPLCTSPDPEALQPYPWVVFSNALAANMTPDEARAEVWRAVALTLSARYTAAEA